MGEEAVRQKRRGRRHRPLALLLLAVPLLSTSFVGAFRPSIPLSAARLARLGAGVRIGNGDGRLQGRCIRPLASSLAMDPPSDDDGVDGAAVDESKQQAQQAEEQQVVPSLGALLRFTIPTLGIWLAGPIMSLVRASG